MQFFMHFQMLFVSKAPQMQKNGPSMLQICMSLFRIHPALSVSDVCLMVMNERDMTRPRIYAAERSARPCFHQLTHVHHHVIHEDVDFAGLAAVERIDEMNAGALLIAFRLTGRQ